MDDFTKTATIITGLITLYAWTILCREIWKWLHYMQILS